MVTKELVTKPVTTETKVAEQLVRSTVRKESAVSEGVLVGVNTSATRSLPSG